MYDAIAFATFATDAPDRLAALYAARSRAYQWAAATTGTSAILSAFDLVTFATAQHAAECG